MTGWSTLPGQVAHYETGMLARFHRNTQRHSGFQIHGMVTDITTEEGSGSGGSTIVSDSPVNISIYPFADIVWSGVSFKGKVNPNSVTQMPGWTGGAFTADASVVGSVSRDGAELVSFKISITDIEYQTSATFVHVPLNIDERDRSSAFPARVKDSTPEEIKNYVTTAEYHYLSTYARLRHEKTLNSVSWNELPGFGISLKAIFSRQ